MVIAVDFDGTIVEHKYPEIGKEIPFAIATLKKLQNENHKLILWSCREGKLLEDAVEFCKERGVIFYAVNSNYDDEPMSKEAGTSCRKIDADMFIDDRNVGGLPDWGVIYKLVHRRWSYDRYLKEMEDDLEEEKPSIWSRIFG